MINDYLKAFRDAKGEEYKQIEEECVWENGETQGMLHHKLNYYTR
jgi:hypothetical protein